MSLLVTVYGQRGGLMLSEGRSVTTSGSGWVPLADDRFKQIRLNAELALGCCGFTPRCEQVKAWAQASPWTVDSLADALPSYLSTLDIGRYPRNIAGAILGYSERGQRMRCITFESQLHEDKPGVEFDEDDTANLGPCLTMTAQGVDDITKKCIEHFEAGIGLCRKKRLLEIDLILRAIIADHARSDVRINDQVRSEIIFREV